MTEYIKLGERDDMLLPVWSLGIHFKNIQEEDAGIIATHLSIINNKKIPAKERNESREKLKDIIRVSGVAKFDDEVLNAVYKTFWDKAKKQIPKSKNWKELLDKIFSSKLKEYKDINKYKGSVKSYLGKCEAKSSDFVGSMEDDFKFNFTTVARTVTYFKVDFLKDIPGILKDANNYEYISTKSISVLAKKLLDEITPNDNDNIIISEADDNKDPFGDAFGDDFDDDFDGFEDEAQPVVEDNSKDGSKDDSNKSDNGKDKKYSVSKMVSVFRKYSKKSGALGDKGSNKFNILYFGIGASLANHYGRSDIEKEFIRMKEIRTNWGRISFATGWLIKFNNLGMLDPKSGFNIFSSDDVIEKVKDLVKDNLKGLEDSHKHWNGHKKTKKSKKKNKNKEKMKRRIKK